MRSFNGWMKCTLSFEGASAAELVKSMTAKTGTVADKNKVA